MFLILVDAPFLSALGLALFTFVLVDFIQKIGVIIPVLETILLIACFQWIVGAYIDYHSEQQHYKYHMYVPEDQYMILLVPSLLIFSAVTYYFSSRLNYNLLISRIKYYRASESLAIGLIVTGFISEILGKFMPGAIGFIFYLATFFRYIGIIYLFFAQSRYKWYCLALVYVYLFWHALVGGMFHELLLWTIWLAMFIALNYRVLFMRKVLFLAMGVVFIFFLQLVKGEYRKIIWSGAYQGNRLELFLDLLMNVAVEDNDPLQEEDVSTVNNRLNQGWIISKVMEHIPEEEPYLYGETIKEALYSSLIPRFLDDQKKGGGGKYVFEKLTGLTLLSRTAMGVSIVGEAYGNFGVTGTYLFMFIWGLVLASFLRMIVKSSKFYYTVILWLPVVFFQVIKAESDLLTVSNHLVKSTIFVFSILFILKRIFKTAV